MKSPAELAARWALQWQQADTREFRLLDPAAWPIELAIGKPSAATVSGDIASAREHVQRWRAVSTGDVEWQRVSYRSVSEPIELPVRWRLRSPSEWIAATENPDVCLEFERLDGFVRSTDALFHRLLIRQLHLWRDKTDEEVLQATRLVLALAPGCAAGRPLRALPVAGIDSKFFERHRALIIPLLDRRFDGQVSEIGLEAFLGAPDEGDHWLLLAPLEPGLLPFAQQRVRARELVSTPLPGTHVLIVENERCLHQLPSLPGTVAILGAGLDLDWLRAPWLQEKRLGYWGDIDTWGLTMLARAKCLQPRLTALLMDEAVFAECAHSAVAEPIPAGGKAPEGLDEAESSLYAHLKGVERGRLEQEFLPQSLVEAALTAWREAS